MAKGGSMFKNVKEEEVFDKSSNVERIIGFRQGSSVPRTSKDSRVWIHDKYKIPLSNSYASGLYNLAWARAVNNKPLDEVLVRNFTHREDLNTHATDNEEKKKLNEDNNVDCTGCNEPGDDDKEEGELEEGEIELETESGQESETVTTNLEASEEDFKMKTFNTRMDSVREVLRTTITVEDDKSFNEFCLRIQTCWDNLREMWMTDRTDIIDALIQQTFSAILTTNSAFTSSSAKQQENNKGGFLRLLTHVKNYSVALLSFDQIRQIEAMMLSLVADSSFVTISSVDKVKEIRTAKEDCGLISSRSLSLEPLSVVNGVLNYLHRSSELVKPEISMGFKSAPLIDLHADYDEDCLPSPTRENISLPSCTQQKLPVIPSQKFEGNKDGLVGLKPNVVDGLESFSSYQQKFSRASYFPSSELPSPTPSDECDNNEEENSIGEVSSSNIMINMRSNSPTILPQVNTTNLSSVLGKINGQSDNGLKPTIKTPSKSRDPRLRISCSNESVNDVGVTNIQVFNSSKHRSSAEPLFISHPHKKQRSGGTEVECQETNAVTEKIGTDIMKVECLRDETNIGVHNSNLVGASLPSLLKDVAVNPSILLDLLKLKHHKLVMQSQLGSVELGHLNAISSPASFPRKDDTHTKPVVLPPGSAQSIPTQRTTVVSQSETRHVRIKPRDPRRILHNNTIMKSELERPLQHQTNENNNLTVREHGEQAQTPFTSQSFTSPPDISPQFTQKLKNVAQIISSSTACTTILAAPKIENREIKVVLPNPNEQQSAIDSTCENSPDSSTHHNHWEDMDTLFEGYDEQQKAAIQRERTRRIEEQNKMFAARKLCLVLDLDHTLLNSAKFVDVDKTHEEILRKKEEIDREKPQRHLFRFPHMGMWTKLRPGIWNFLEKASKLYELHLYTMGNKSYATEMAKVLDPSGVLFAGRVMSRGDDDDFLDGDERVQKTKDLDGVLGMESAVVIIDDSVRVWPLNKHNLIVVERYTYFPCSRRQFGLMGPSLLEIDHDERPEDGTLASSLAVIERIHQNFFCHRSLKNIDVRNILSSEQKKILAGCRIVFSRIFPVGEANPHLHPLWQTAEQFGAVCTNQIDDQVTHVVAHSLGTDKVNWALSTKRYVVYPGWVEASALLYRRANEMDFIVKV